jgi:hypothetical protein
MRLFDDLFAGYRRYRRWRGGVWFCRYIDAPVFSYVWSRTPLTGYNARGETKTEDYTV